MLYGDEKLREMARSILPSSRRKSSRDSLALAKRRNRRTMRMALRAALNEGELEDNVDPYDYPDHEIRGLVRDRQNGDKLNHFIKWAKAHTADMGDDASGRFAKMRSILPDGLIGWHACTHLRFINEFDHEGRFDWLRRPRKRVAQPAHQREVQIRVLKAALDSAFLTQELNRTLREGHRHVVWVIGYDKNLYSVTQKVYGGHVKDDNGYRTVWKEVVTWHLRERRANVGPSVPQIHSTSQIEEFLEKLDAARSARPKVYKPWQEKKIVAEVAGPNGEKRYSVKKIRRDTRPNPEYHYEWRKSFVRFVELFLACEGKAHHPHVLARAKADIAADAIRYPWRY